MTPVLAMLLHGDGMDIIYFWSSIFMVLLPIGGFSWLTWVLIKAYRKEQGARSAEQKAPH
jgi:hypothetical protein